jgi:D-amino peptidase
MAFVLMMVFGASAFGQAPKPKKVFMETDMEGVDGIFDFDLQCIPWKSPRWDESRKLLTGEINAAVEGLLAGGASDVTVLDGHTGGSGLSLLDLHPKAKLITGIHDVPTTLGLDSSCSALIFIGRHAMSGADKGILAHTEMPDIRNAWVNGIPVGEFGFRVFLAAEYGIPTIMVSGDTAACKEAEALVPGIECAEVKSGFNETSGIMLPRQEACDLIRERARRAMERLAEFKPKQLSAPVELKIQLSHELGATYDRTLLTHGAEQLPDWTFVFRGRSFREVWVAFKGR